MSKWKITDALGFSTLINFIKQIKRASDVNASEVSALQEDIQGLVSQTTQTFAQVDTALETLDSEKADKLYATCTTAAGTTAKVATLVDAPEDFALKQGMSIFVKFTSYNTAASPTLNVNSTGAIAIKKYGTTAVGTYMWYSGAVIEFVYDGTYWIMSGNNYAATTTYYGPTKLSSSTNSTSTALAATPSAVKAAYDLANSKQAAMLHGSFTIPTSGWNSDTTSDWPYYYDVAVSGVTASDVAQINFSPVNYNLAKKLCPVCETLTGVIRLRASSIPTAAIAAEYSVEKG